MTRYHIKTKKGRFAIELEFRGKDSVVFSIEDVLNGTLPVEAIRLLHLGLAGAIKEADRILSGAKLAKQLVDCDEHIAVYYRDINDLQKVEKKLGDFMQYCDKVYEAWFILREHIEKVRKEKGTEVKTGKEIKQATNSRVGFVYLLFLSCSGHHKIGHSNNPDRRIWKEISPQLPEQPEVICAIETEDRFVLESELHKKFSDKRTNGEWFKLEPKDVDYIKGLANGTKAIQ